MGKCHYCGQSAGFLRSVHTECKERDERAKRQKERAQQQMREMGKDAARSGTGLDDLPDRMRAVAARAGFSLNSQQLYTYLSDGWSQALEEGLADSHLSAAEISMLNRYRTRLGIPEEWLNRSEDFDKFRLAVSLGFLKDGVIPRFDMPRSQLPFNLMKSEEMIATFDDVRYYKEVTRREYRGQSMGVSVRVAKGVYLRPGAFRGRPVETVSMEHQDNGTLGLTTKHLYYLGESTGRSFRIRLEKIVTFDPYDDGLRIMRDTASAKPEAFIMDNTDAWFLINAIYAVMDLDEVALPRGDAPTVEDLLEEAIGDSQDSADDGFALGSGGMHSLGT